MSPRPWTIKVEDHPDPRQGQSYPCRITKVEKSTKPPGIELILNHTLPEQEGRTHEIVLPLPIRPGGIGQSLFEACAQRVAVGAELRPAALRGQIVGVLFERSAAGTWEPVCFEPIPNRENTHDDTDQQPAPASKPAPPQSPGTGDRSR